MAMRRSGGLRPIPRLPTYLWTDEVELLELTVELLRRSATFRRVATEGSSPTSQSRMYSNASKSSSVSDFLGTYTRVNRESCSTRQRAFVSLEDDRRARWRARFVDVVRSTACVYLISHWIARLSMLCQTRPIRMHVLKSRGQGSPEGVWLVTRRIAPRNLEVVSALAPTKCFTSLCFQQVIKEGRG